ncbi:MAG: glycosyltransferase [Steroidobacteraceae bacterium]
MLNWSMIICTLNRLPLLQEALQTVVWQTRPPRQIIIVDSSADWEHCRDVVMAGIASRHPQFEWIYLGSSTRSLTAQRNIGLARCSSDIAFLFDDDTFAFPDCAEQILRVYERDAERRIGGVSAMLSPFHPAHELPPEWGKAMPESSAGPSQRYSRLADFMRSWWDQYRLFIPYDGDYHWRDTEWLGMGGEVGPVQLFHGCRMTFRTAAIREAGGFSEALTRQCFGEDIDASYRVSRRHQLVEARKALVHHLLSPRARAGVSVQTTLVLLNAIVLYWIHAAGGRPRQGAVLRFALTRLGAEMVRDMVKPWRGLPHFRGILRALPRAIRLSRLSKQELLQVYPSVQTELLDSKRR